MKKFGSKQTRILLPIFLLIVFWNCEVKQNLPKKGRTIFTSFSFEKKTELFHRKLHSAGPSGWMIEIFDPAFEAVATYVFCTNHRCNLTKDGSEFIGQWILKKDNILIRFDQEITPQGIQKPYNKHNQTYQNKKNQKGRKSFRLCTHPKEIFSWNAIFTSALNGNQYPYKMISMDADCE